MNIYKQIFIGLVILSILGVILKPVDVLSFWIWTPETGKWINPKYAAKDTPKEQFQYAMSFFKHEEYKRAIKEFDKLVNIFPKSMYASESQYFMGKSYEKIEQYYKAFKAYQKVIDKYPYIEKVDEIIEKEFEIGNMFFEGKKGKLWGMPVINPEDRAIEIFKKVVENAPYGKKAEGAYYKLGMAYKKAGDYQKARESFSTLVKNFPDSQLVDKAEYQAAHCAFKFSLDPSYDQQATDEAISEFKQFVKKHPESELSKKADNKLNELNNKRAKKIFDIAEFYESQGHKKSAIMYYEEVVAKYPDTEWATKAMEKITIINRK